MSTIKRKRSDIGCSTIKLKKKKLDITEKLNISNDQSGTDANAIGEKISTIKRKRSHGNTEKLLDDDKLQSDTDASAIGEKISFKRHADFFVVISMRDTKGTLRHIAKEGWSDKLTELIWQQTKLQCSWSFKRASVRLRSRDIVIDGKCTDCTALIRAIHDIESEEITVHIEEVDSSIEHKGKRRIVGEKRIEIGMMVEGSSAFAVRNKLADKAMVAGDIVPAHIPNGNVIRKVRSELLKVKHTDSIVALKLLKCGAYRGDIQSIGHDPFYVQYATRLQTNWYNSEFANDCAILAIDATGIGLKKLDTSQSNRLLYYQIVAKGTPLLQNILNLFVINLILVM